jgi:hypothetical protein
LRAGKNAKELEERRLRALAKKYPSWGNALLDGCNALHDLNHFAKDVKRWKQDIYKVKNDIIKILYQNGFATECYLQVMKLPEKVCWNCNGTGIYRGRGECWDCYGTGTFAKGNSTTLVCFRFVVDDKTFCWHQPQSSIRWPYVTTAEPSCWEPRGSFRVDMSNQEYRDDMRLVNWIIDQYNRMNAEATSIGA